MATLAMSGGRILQSGGIAISSDAGGSSVSGTSWPRLGASYVGGTRNYGTNSTITTYMKHINYFIYAIYEGWEAQWGVTQASFVQAVQSGSLCPGGTKIFGYYDPIYLNSGNATTVMSTAGAGGFSPGKAILLSAYPGGSNVLNSNGQMIGNLGSSNAPTTTVGVGSISRTPTRFQADYAWDLLIGGGSLGLLSAGIVVAPNPTLNGIAYDDFDPQVHFTGDWTRNGVGGQGGNLGNSVADQSQQAGWAALCARTRVNTPGILISGNFGSLYQSPINLTTAQGIFNEGECQSLSGWVFSLDSGNTLNAWLSMMALYAKQKAFAAASPIMGFNHVNITDDGRDFYRTTPFQAVRYGFNSCLQDDGYYEILPTDSIPNNTLTNVNPSGLTQTITGTGQWFDEFSVDATVSPLRSQSYGSVTQSGRGWIGTAIDPGGVGTPFQGIVGNGTTTATAIYRRRYQMPTGQEMWSMINPTSNPVVVNYGRPMQSFLGSKETTVNNGALNFSSETIPAQDGRNRVTYP